MSGDVGGVVATYGRFRFQCTGGVRMDAARQQGQSKAIRYASGSCRDERESEDVACCNAPEIVDVYKYTRCLFFVGVMSVEAGA